MGGGMAGGMVMTPMGLMPAAMAMGMGGPMMGGYGGPGMMEDMGMMSGPMGMGGAMGMVTLFSPILLLKR